MRAKFTVGIVTCVALFAVAGCGGDDEETTTTTTTPSGTSGATGADAATDDSAAADGDVTAQLETVLQEQGGFTEEQAQCVAPKISDEIESPEELNTQKGVQTLIDASFDAVIECGGPTP